MKKIILSLLLLCLIACKENKKTYKYIEIIDDESITGEIERIEKDTVVLEAENDSLAYLEAYNKFSISKKVHFDSMKADIKTYSTPLEYKLIDEKGNDIMPVENVFNLVKGKAEIDKSLSNIDSGIKKITSDVNQPTKIDSQKVKSLKSFFNHKSDEYSEDKTTWITPKAAAPFRNQNGTYCYFSQNNLRFVFQYHSDDWLFIKKYQFLIDGKPFEYIPDEVKRDNDESGITEWFDQSVNESNKDIVEALAKAKKAKVKLIGDSYVDYQTITEKQLLAFKRTLEYYKALGNRF